MSFPQTRQTLIQRIVGGSGEEDWREFVADYWGPIFRFARRQGNLGNEDAEDIASLTFEAVVKNELLARWITNRSARLRTLLCTVVRNLISNFRRVEAGRARILREQIAAGTIVPAQAREAEPEDIDSFYAAWVEETVQGAVESLVDEYHRSGHGDRFRVLYGRVCERMTTAEIAASLQIPMSAAENHYKHARNRLGEKLRELVRNHVLRYSAPEKAEEEVEIEWAAMGEYLAQHGDLEGTLERAYQWIDPLADRQRLRQSMDATVIRLAQLAHERGGETDQGPPG